MKIKLKIVALLLLFATQLHAQQTRTVTGKVTDARTGEALPGVTIKAGNSNLLTQTNSDGTFSLSLPSATQSLTFSYVGYADAQVSVTDNMTVQMTTTEKNLNEVVVVGYGQTVRRQLTGSIAKVTSKEVENVPLPSFESAIQGKAAGVVIESGSGKLGQGIKIRIRGTSSISASSQPLYVIDGLPITSTSQSDVNNDATNPLIDINPNDIESVEVLKDASASAIYGSRAANGVVLITTKKGRNNQKTTLQLDANTSISNPARHRHFLDAKQYVDLIHIAAKNDGTFDFEHGYDLFGVNPQTVEDDIAAYEAWYEENVLDAYSLGTDWRKPEVNTDWTSLLYNHNAPASQINLSASGGDNKTRFFASGFYNVQDAIVIDNKFYRYGGRLNLEHNPTDRLSLGMNVAVDRSELDRVSNDNAFSTPGQLVAQLPISPLYDPQTGELNSQTLYPNGLFDAQFNTDKQVTYRTIGNVFGNYNLLPSLSFRTEFGADIFNLDESAFQGKETIDGGGIGKANLISSQSTTFNTNNYFTYTPKIGDNSKLNAVVGMSYLQNDTKQSSSYGEQTPSDQIKNLSGTTSITFANSTDFRYTFLSYFARANYSFKDKYLFSASLRDDGSSRFGPNNRYGLFPAVSAGWIISDEKFMENSSVLNYLKLRGSWGLTGNAEIGEGSYLTLYGVSNYPNLPGFTPVQLSNPDLKWEKTAQTDIGLDFGIFKSRVTAEMDFYYKKTSDLLLNVNIPATTGYTFITRNLGNMQNKGFEIAINSTNIDNGGFRWTTSFNAAYNKNEVLDINGQVIEAGFSLTQRAVEGFPIGEFYAQQFVGVDPKTGDAQYLGENGKPTTNFGKAARVPLGNSNPDWTGGLTNTFTYKGFDLNVFFTFVSGNKIYNAGGVYMSAGFYNGFDNQTTDMMDSWQKPGDQTNIPRVGWFFGSG
ncbi:MAG TPA: SusC/RagA family TonB-linked outer membrane protein, partial [Parafilimonas sp.]|nr:SusC/RagA family TonB-linked outer membrane protein [Parafilimonas sp.]